MAGGSPAASGSVSSSTSAGRQILRSIEASMALLLWTPGREGDERRGRVMPLFLAGDPRLPDLLGHGPEGPHDAAALALMR